MFTLDQRQYLEEVLGLNSAGYVLAADPQTGAVADPQAAVQAHELLVLTYPLRDDERALLAKILASVKLGPYTHLEEAGISLAEFPAGHSAPHVLAFANYPPGQHKFAEGHWTVLPPVSLMTGANAEVVARKKETWNLLQQFVRERS